MRSTYSALATLLTLFALGGIALAADKTAEMPAVVHKPSVDVHSGPDFSAPTIAKLNRDAPVKIAGQQGLWFRLNMPAGKAGYVRVNDVRMAYSGKENSDANMRALFTGKAGKGRVTETASVRGIDESDLQSAGFNAVQFARLESYRLTPDAAAAHARASGWVDSTVPYATEARPVAAGGRKQATQSEKRGGLSAARGLLSRIGNLGGVLGAADAVVPKSEQELTAEELALGPEIAGRILGAAPLWKDDAAQRRVNQIGRWLASHTSRPELPWTFGIIDSSEVNAFAAPGGYVLITRGLYNLLADDGEVAAVLGHEISHAVQRDHYEVIRKQGMTSVGADIAASQVNVGGGIVGGFAKDYVKKHGAKIALTRLDREAEFRSDEASEIYLARTGFNPLSMYMVLQKMTALGAASAKLAQMYKTHPPLDDRLDRIDRRGYAGLERYTQR
ncbi:MAG: M48 family metalloprotease [Lysobacter sp.]|nr:M48 family metalloprotease [Lysobacter sp.]